MVNENIGQFPGQHVLTKCDATADATNADVAADAVADAADASSDADGGVAEAEH